jgi:CxxC motif-containing protein
MLKPIMVETAKVKARPPVKAGDVIVKNVLKTKADLIATTDWQAGAGEG